MRECRLVLHKEYSFLGASPDQLVSENGMFGLVEIKCSYSTVCMIKQSKKHVKSLISVVKLAMQHQV